MQPGVSNMRQRWRAGIFEICRLIRDTNLAVQFRK
jgi:hypothetical protein